jgi:hypothetical protein
MACKSLLKGMTLKIPNFLDAIRTLGKMCELYNDYEK